MPEYSKYLLSPKYLHIPAGGELFSWLHLHHLEKKFLIGYIKSHSQNSLKSSFLGAEFWKMIPRIERK
jgi:hypothetical protein